VPEKMLTVDQVLALLAHAPTAIAEATADLEPARLRRSPAKGEWSANEVLGHLRSCADVCGGCIAVILTQSQPKIRAINPRTWIKGTNYLELDFHASLDAYAQQRSELMKVLHALTEDEWSLSITVTGAGKTLERTTFFYAHWLATHERAHVKQIERLADEVRSLAGLLPARPGIEALVEQTPGSDVPFP
jgi:hypothetical protein